VRLSVDIIVFVKTEGQGDVAMPVPVTTYLLANLDLLCATYDGLGTEVAEFAVKNNLLALIHVMLNKETFNEMVGSTNILLELVIFGQLQSVWMVCCCWSDPSLAERDECIPTSLL